LSAVSRAEAMSRSDSLRADSRRAEVSASASSRIAKASSWPSLSICSRRVLGLKFCGTSAICRLASASSMRPCSAWSIARASLSSRSLTWLRVRIM
jgi:hypothetical protein